MDSGEKGMNPVAVTIIKPWKKYLQNWRFEPRPSVFKSLVLPTELWDWAKHCGKWKKILLAVILFSKTFAPCVRINRII